MTRSTSAAACQRGEFGREFRRDNHWDLIRLGKCQHQRIGIVRARNTAAPKRFFFLDDDLALFVSFPLHKRELKAKSIAVLVAARQREKIGRGMPLTARLALDEQHVFVGSL